MKGTHPWEDENMRTKHPEEAEHDDTPLNKPREQNVPGGTIAAHVPTKLIH